VRYCFGEPGRRPFWRCRAASASPRLSISRTAAARLGILALNRNSSIAAMSSACKWICRRLVRVSFSDDTGFLPSLAQPLGGDQQWLGRPFVCVCAGHIMGKPPFCFPLLPDLSCRSTRFHLGFRSASTISSNPTGCLAPGGSRTAGCDSTAQASDGNTGLKARARGASYGAHHDLRDRGGRARDNPPGLTAGRGIRFFATDRNFKFTAPGASAAARPSCRPRRSGFLWRPRPREPLRVGARPPLPRGAACRCRS
jgi:hypothetical protein